MKNESTELKNARGGSGEETDIPSASQSQRIGASGGTRKKPSKRAKAKQGVRRAQSVKAPATALGQSKTPVTEKPVPLTPPEKTSQYILTVDNATGLATKIEKLDAGTGKKKELSQAEYLQVVSSNANPLPVSNFESLGGYSGAPEGGNAALTEAYYRGVVDYLNALGLS